MVEDTGSYLLVLSAALFIVVIAQLARSRIKIRTRDVSGQIVVGNNNRVEQTVTSARSGESSARRIAFWVNWALGILATALGIVGFFLKSGS